ncbi:MAG TPA: crossover junction endodeoxyribonuclease RuvC [Ktedonobacterales bacterium]|jgi:crossover junction endodeoxyribonuclease RuvC
MSATPDAATNPPAARLVLGIDPGTARLGYAVVRAERNALSLVCGDVISTAPGREMHLRLLEIHRALLEIIAATQPSEMAVEELFFAKNVTTAIGVGQARGVALLTAAETGLSVTEYKPMQVKQAIHGYGLASKAQVGEMVRVLLNLAVPLRPDDAADAAAIAICHVHSTHLSVAQSRP